MARGLLAVFLLATFVASTLWSTVQAFQSSTTFNEIGKNRHHHVYISSQREGIIAKQISSSNTVFTALDRRRSRQHHTPRFMTPPQIMEAPRSTTTPVKPSSSSSSKEPAVRLNVIDINRRGEEAIPVVVLHGLLGSSRNFRSWTTALHERLDKPRRVLIPDLRNHGSSAHVSSMTYRDMANDILHLLDSHGIDKAILVGHSMGGKVSSAAALANPHRIAGLVVMDIAPVTYSITDGTNWQDTHKVIEILSKMPMHTIKDKGDADRLLVEMGLEDAGMRAFALTNMIPSSGEGQHMKWQMNIEGIKRSLGDIAGFDVGESALDGSTVEAMYPHKTLFLNGGKSKYLRAAHLSVIAQLFPTFSLATIRNAGHWVHAEAPEDTLRIVQRYLDEEVQM